MNAREKIVEALSAPQCIISVMGAHAGEDADEIFNRKIDDITKVNRTFWLIKSPKAKPEVVQKMCQLGFAYVLFVEPATKGGARPAITNQKASTFSEDGLIWNQLPTGLSPVTGKLDSQAYALVFDKLSQIDESQIIDLWSYADFSYPEKPVRMILGCSTVCATKRDMRGDPDRLKSRFRNIVAVARLVAPYCVWIRQD
jgi:hypothetical protein